MTTQPYACRSAGQKLYLSNQTKIKIYFVDIYGRQFPERYEWSKSSLQQDTIDQLLKEKNIKGIGIAV